MKLNLKIIVILFLAFLSIKLSAQENCDCSEMLKELVGKIENKTLYLEFGKMKNSE